MFGLKFLFYFFIFSAISCVSEPKLDITEDKIISFYIDLYLQKEFKNLELNDKKKPSDKEITVYALKKNKLTITDLKKINSFFYNNPKTHKEILEKIEKRIDSLFKEDLNKPPASIKKPNNHYK